MIRKAFILAAGFGTRMLPLTRVLPKPMFPIGGVPALERALQLVRAWGARDVLVNVHHLPQPIVEHVRTRKPDGLRVQISFEPDILGTGGALVKARWFFDDNPFWLFNADVAANVNAAPLIRAMQNNRAIAAVWMHPNRGPRTVEMENGIITNWQSKRRGTPGTFTFTGLHLLSPKILDFLPPTGASSIITAYEKAAAAGHRVAGVTIPRSTWADIGTPEQYLEAHADFAGQRSGFAAIDPSATIHPRARIENAVIGPGAQLGPHAVARNVVIAANTKLNAEAQRIAMPARDALDARERNAVASLKWPVDDVTAIALSPRGSARSFTRLCRDRESAMLIHYDASRTENTYYAAHAQLLRKLKLPVPRVLVDRPADGLTIFEDLGHVSLYDLVKARGAATCRGHYEKLLDVVVRFHEAGIIAARKSRIPTMPAFRPTLYRWERNYFAEQMLQKRQGLLNESVAPILRELERVGNRLNRAPRVLVHRDLQSSNVLWKGGRPWLIDFQGMRPGPAAYDLASLLCDPYVELPEPLIIHLLEHYAEQSAHPDGIRRLFWLGAIQRLAQALGAFAKLGSVAETKAFAAHIPAAMRMMHRAAGHAGDFPALRAWANQAFLPG